MSGIDEYIKVCFKNDAKKFDEGKPPLSLLPRSFLEGVAGTFADGEKKYGRYNYLKGMNWDRMIDAALRHITAFNDGEDYAEDSGKHHIHHAAACLAILSDYIAKDIGTDTRYKPDTISEKTRDEVISYKQELQAYDKQSRGE
jgi:hypothetical protein